VRRLARARDLVDRSDDLFRVDGVTVSRYGPCGPGFTLMREPYQGPNGEPTYYAASGRRAATPGVTRRQALDMWTREAAHVLRWDGIGSLEPGQHADLVVVDRDPLRCPVEDLPGTQVIATLVGGRTVAGADLT
jgi:hypothetical protein